MCGSSCCASIGGVSVGGVVGSMVCVPCGFDLGGSFHGTRGSVSTAETGHKSWFCSAGFDHTGVCLAERHFVGDGDR
jgi:hypothetical protein